MSVLPIRQIGDPVLRTVSSPVTLTDGKPDARILSLINDMYDTNNDAGGIGIAAPQVGVNLRIFTYDVEGQRGAVINPELEVSGEPDYVPRSDSTPENGAAEDIRRVLREGCLSVSGGIYGPVKRYPHVMLSGIAPDGSTLHVPADGLLAACFQHEVDHLDGALFLNRLEGEHRKVAMRALRERSPA